ncbi:MAG TPA: TetR/AcrR family transcriptional regulator [Paenibacillus sp.]|uniref:TetR/AcrR family transcriptional regulator n=1 Tax=Paenibacillus TaxID=44249 RepID=UPI000B9FD98B|nr:MULTISPECIES: TetR/AcrR family transcriptional regulator [Paenibacillus]OZQ71861.1 TetR family transcriptional regulator [Paenibacillus taichungensis]HBU83958.1 TetR/AcrR family transcriptional regulator [Paenibacillus sp.]
MDRRIQKSRESIIEAFIQLLSERKFEQITINQIAERANVSRGTVYLHFMDKFDLLDQCIKSHLVEMIESSFFCGVTGIFPSKEALLHSFRYLKEHALFYGAVLDDQSVPEFRTRLQAALLRGLDKQIDMTGINQGRNKEIMLQFLASALAGMIEWWITSAEPYSAEELVDELWILMERNQMTPVPHV